MSKKKRKVTNFFETNLLNDLTYGHYYNIFQQICMSMFEWENLPNTMNARYLEETLFTLGRVALLYDDKYLYINTPCSTSEKLDIYNEPTRLNCYSIGYQAERLVYKGKKADAKNTDCVLVYNNNTKTPTSKMIDLYAYRLYNCTRTQDINLNAQKTPIILLADQESKLTLQNAFSQIEGNELKIVLKKNFDLNSIQTLNLKADFIADKISEEKCNIWNEALTMLGINNIKDKKERLVSSETEQNNELINFNLQSFLIPRQEACKKFNELFELPEDKKINVRVRSDLKNIIKTYESIIGIKEKQKLESNNN